MRLTNLLIKHQLLGLLLTAIFAPIVGVLVMIFLCIFDAKSLWWIGLIILGVTALISLISALIYRALKRDAQYSGVIPTQAEIEARKQQQLRDEQQAQQERQNRFYDN